MGGAQGAAAEGGGSPGYTADGYVCGATPVSDGERIVALFHPGLAVCYDLDGNLLWTHGVSKDGRNPGMGAAVCPAIGDGKVVLDCGNIMRCLNVADGSVVWSRDCSKINRSFGWGAASPVIGQAGGVYYFMCHQGDVCRLDTGEVVVQCWWQAEKIKGKLNRYWQNTISPDRKTFHAITHAVRIPDDPAKPPYLLWNLTREQVDSRSPEWIFGSSHNYAAPMVVDAPPGDAHQGRWSMSTTPAARAAARSWMLKPASRSSARSAGVGSRTVSPSTPGA